MFHIKNSSISYTLTFRDEPVRPGAFLRVKGIYGAVQFECIVHDEASGDDYLLVHHRNVKRLVHVRRLLGVVTKRSRRKNGKRN